MNAEGDKKLADVFRAAAKFCEDDGNRISYFGPRWWDGACDVLLYSGYPFRNTDAHSKFYTTFVQGEGYSVMRHAFRDEPNAHRLAQECRILALCFAAAMAETGDL